MLWELATGSVRVLAIEDGGHRADPRVVFPTSTPGHFDGDIRISFGCFLVEKGEELALIDVGLGSDVKTREGVVTGQLLDALRVLDLDPGAIGTVIHTHVHPDHVGGHVRKGSLVFTNADVFIHRDDLNQRPWADYPLPNVIRASMTPLRESGRVTAATSMTRLPLGLGLVETPGHTPGHVSIEVRTDDGPILITGDVTHNPAQLEHPSWHAATDMDIPAANRARRELFARAVRDGAHLAAGHYDKPGFGRVVGHSGAWRFIPVG